MNWTLWKISLYALLILTFILGILRKSDNKQAALKIISIGLCIALGILLVIKVKDYLIDMKRKKECTNTIIEYLNDKYGNANYKVKEIRDMSKKLLLERLFYPPTSTYEYTLTGDYFDEPFNITINFNTNEIVEEEFLIDYAVGNNWCSNLHHYDCLENAVVLYENKYIKNPDDYKVDLFVSFNRNLSKRKFGKAPTIEDILLYTKIDFNYFTIYKNFDNQNIDEFKEFIVGMYKDYVKYYKKFNGTNKIDFKFENGNPFIEEKQGSYVNKGYIKESKEGIDIYVNDNPIFISKELLK